MISVAILIRSLEIGGSERQAVLLAKGLADSGHDVHIVVVRGGGALEDEARSIGIPVHSVTSVQRAPFEVVALARRHHIDVAIGYLDVGNMLSLVMRISSGACAVFGVRASGFEYSAAPRLTRLLARLEPWASRLSHCVIANSEAGIEFARARGFPASKLVLVPNGVDTHRFSPDAARRDAMRAAWAAGAGRRIVGTVARVHPVKGPQLFVAAAELLAARRDDVEFVWVAPAADVERFPPVPAALASRIRAVHQPEDVADAYRAFDVFTSTSRYGEGLQNALLEAMATNNAVVATDVGDARRLIAHIGLCVPPDDPQALADAWELAMAAPGGGRGLVESRYSVAALVNATMAAVLR